MTDPRLIDFDAYRAEQDSSPLLVRVGGKDYELPSSPPASIALDAIRLSQGGVKKVPPEEVSKLAEGLFGKAMLDELVGVNRFTVNDLKALIELVMARYSAEANPPPNRASRRKQRRNRST